MSGGKGIVLISGGLDSLLAARVLMEQNIDITGLYFVLPFVEPDADPGQLLPVQIAVKNNIAVRTQRCGEDYLEIIRNPQHGYGKHANPCIDCHLYFIRKAAELMRETGADFVATGEVVGQRPMSQMRHTLNHIEKSAGLQGRLLRPLSAKLLKPTIPEEEGIVNRDQLLGISGRGRKDQLKLAEKYNITGYTTPSGGCLFTDEFISRRVKDLFGSKGGVEPVDLYLLTVGRHFRLHDTAKIIVSRNEKENNALEKYRNMSDYFFIPGFKGPAVYARGELSSGDMEMICAIILRYGKPDGVTSRISVYKKGNLLITMDASRVISDDQLERLRI
ncbi:MAG: tRNA 4-thiouridine(8) synthase ThiI [Smithella sp.]|nr:tRNA 4-thiouridine(8) synthase ThiI [Smithella sp.]